MKNKGYAKFGGGGGGGGRVQITMCIMGDVQVSFLRFILAFGQHS